MKVCLRIASLVLLMIDLPMNARGANASRWLCEAESICADRSAVCAADKGYAFANPTNAVGGWITASAKNYENGRFVPAAPVQLTLAADAIPPGEYRLALRLLRWTATQNTAPVTTLIVQGDQFRTEYRFTNDTEMLTVAGGVYSGAGRWQWIELPQAISVSNQATSLDLSCAGGSGNYLGLLVDALEFRPNRAEGEPERTLVPIAGGPGTDLHLLKLAGNDFPLASPHARDGWLAAWVRMETPVRSVAVRIGDGQTTSAAIPLARLVEAMPVRLGCWYLASLASSVPELQPLDRRRPWTLRVQIEPLASETRVIAGDWQWTSSLERLGARVHERTDPDVSREIHVVSELRRLRPRPVGERKKLILWPQTGLVGGNPDTAFVRAHASAIKRDGVNGIVLSVLLKQADDKPPLYGSGSVFNAEPLAWTDFQAAADDVSHTDWRGLEESFLRINVTPGIGWFDDAAWETALEKVRWCARLVKLARIRGILLDTEEYPPCVFFQYPGGPRSFDEYARQAFTRGKQFAQSCQKESPGITLLLTFTGSFFAQLEGTGLFDTRFKNSLLPAFVDGLLAVNGPTVVDGFEAGYTYRTPREFLEGAWLMNRAAAYSRDPDRYRTRMKRGFGLWIDEGGRWNATDDAANYFSPANFENALHWALRVSDGYVWIYTHSINWWRSDGSDLARLPGVRPSAAYERALTASRAAHDPHWLPTEKPTP